MAIIFLILAVVIDVITALSVKLFVDLNMTIPVFLILCSVFILVLSFFYSKINRKYKALSDTEEEGKRKKRYKMILFLIGFLQLVLYVLWYFLLRENFKEAVALLIDSVPDYPPFFNEPL